MKISDGTHIPLEGISEPSYEEMMLRARHFHERIRTRRSVRAFKPKRIVKDVIEACVFAAGSAPSGANHQPWYFACVEKAETKREIRLAAEAEERAFYDGKAGTEWLEALAPIGTDADKAYMETAPVLICIFAQRRGGVDAGDDKKNYYIHESVGIATGFLLAALHEAGLATLVHTPNPMNFLNRICKRPDTEKPYLVVVAGHAADDAMIPLHALKKKTFNELMGWL